MADPNKDPTWSIHSAQDFGSNAASVASSAASSVTVVATDAAATASSLPTALQAPLPDPEGLDLTICRVCGTQYSSPASRTTCPICEDPRQYVPPAGLSWTTLRELRASGGYKNSITPLLHNPHAHAISTSPRLGIGQRAILIKTAEGNVLWDCIAYLDEETVRAVRALGGIKAIIISHPHFYTTAGAWAEVFDCKVYTSALDAHWLQRRTPRHVLFSEPQEIPLARTGALDVAVCGGHFPGSLVLCHAHRLYTADTIQVVPSGLNPPAPKGHASQRETVSFAFMWSYPNMIPLGWRAVRDIWKAVEHLEWRDVHGGFAGLDVYGEGKKRVYDSARIVIKRLGGEDDALYD
ncbi:metallo-beta-lactamase family protein [Calocera viscosa TUFC12733]|uniref:Metallo-beta-lactamase family protein n=1 Tax=Calocera viscosa (strain TUFC12733) TaxID=1330018 RepID=A0A167S2U4_CALVF|nr:metallo-beta-lactamase family protein [Calocera viscosa TUFC12733]